MKSARLVAAAAALGALLGCNPVYSSAPMGEQVVPIMKSDWEGVWFGDGGLIAVQVVNEDIGKLMISTIELGEASDGVGTPPKVESGVVYLRSSGGWLLANHQDPEEPVLWEWARVKKEGDHLILWAPEASAFRQLVSEGTLPGTVEQEKFTTRVTLGELSSAHYEMITSGARGVLLDWDDPLVLVRIHLPIPIPPPPPPPPGAMQEPR